MATAARETTIHLRASAARRALIDQAADALGKSRTDFMLDAATEKAHQVMLDRSLFTVDSNTFAAFTRVLEQPLPPAKGLLKLLSKNAPWE